MEINDDDYIRVTEVLSIFQAYAFVDRNKLKKAQDLGMDVHNAIEDYWNGDFTPLSTKHNYYFESFLKWIDGKEITPLMIEKRLYDNELMIKGKLDLFAEYNELKVIFDYKTGSWAHPEIWELQGTFYRMLLSKQVIDPASHFIFLQLKADGSMPNEFVFEYEPKNEETCKAALQCYKHFKQKTP